MLHCACVDHRSNMVFQHWLSRSTRVTIRQDEQGQIGEVERALFGVAKRGHAVLIAAAIVGGTLLIRILGKAAGWWIETIAHGVAMLAFIGGALGLESLLARAKTLGEQVVSVIAGLLWLGFVAVLMEALFGL